MTDRRDIPADHSKGTIRPTPDGIEIDLRDPFIAGILAWLWPGAGHFYQRRYAKGALFMVCILGTFFFGLVLGEGKVVYASQFRDSSRAVGGFSGKLSRWPFAMQIGVGLPAMPAVVQAIITRKSQDPNQIEDKKPTFLGGWMAPPANPEELNQWNKEMGTRYDLALLYTVIAGLLNWLAIYDAAAGPAFSEPAEDKSKDGKIKDDKDGKTKDKAN
ncbi:MAG: hypothetical protein K8R36_08360 [Planctomycetales bacterium]|nr:hypothetical protein [Planctomycetales bacterium]